MSEGLKYFLFFMAGAITQALIFQPKFRKALVYIFTFQWVRIGISTREETRGKFTYHKDPKKTPKGYRRIYPPPHPGGREKGKRAYPQDDKALELILEQGMSTKQAWEIMRPEYSRDEIWNTLDSIGKGQEYDAFRKRIENRINSLDNN